MNQPDVQRRVRRIECSVLILSELYRDRFEPINQSRGSKDGRRAERRISAVCLASFNNHFGERITLACTNRLQRSRLTDDAVTNTQRLRLDQLLRSNQSDFFIGREYQRERLSRLNVFHSGERGGDEA